MAAKTVTAKKTTAVKTTKTTTTKAGKKKQETTVKMFLASKKVLPPSSFPVTWLTPNRDLVMLLNLAMARGSLARLCST